jgi:hypothetical protein
MTSRIRFADEIVEALRKAKILGVRAGEAHRYTGVWVVVVEGRAFVRSWNDKETGWFRAFRAEPYGTIQVGDREIPVRGVPTRGARLREADPAANGENYATTASTMWVDGFADPARERATLELVPR